MMVLTYCSDGDQLREAIVALYGAGQYHKYLHRVTKLFGEEALIIKGVGSKTTVLHLGSDESLCYWEVDEEDGFDFIRDSGLHLLAQGTNRGGDDDPYIKVQSDPSALRTYKKFYPDLQPTDEDGNPIGVPIFQRGVELARGGFA